MDVTESHRRTSQLIDQIAHQAHIVHNDEHIAGDATAPVGRDVYQHAQDTVLMLPSTRADTIRAGFSNDAVNVGLAQSLYGGPFAAAEAAKRPGMAASAAKSFAASLNGPADANTKLVLQSRADEGFIAGEFANKAVSYLPKDQQPAAAAKWLQESYGARYKDDVAFATGANYSNFLHASGNDAAVKAEMTKIGQREPIANPCVGTIAG